jgi:hypothetical protein
LIIWITSTLLIPALDVLSDSLKAVLPSKKKKKGKSDGSSGLSQVD